MARSVSNVASSLIAWRVFILRIIHRETYVIARRVKPGKAISAWTDDPVGEVFSVE
jgi:hypothetical protein